MPQHVGVDAELHLGGQPKPRHHPAKGNCGHRSAALAHEDISSGSLFSLETPQGAKFDAGQWMDGRHPILKPMHVQAGMDEINLLPAQRTQFGCSQAVPEGHQDHGCITMPVPIVTGRLACMSRAEAFAVVRQHGGVPSQSVTRQTNVLVVGELGWPLLDDGRPSNTLSKATNAGLCGAVGRSTLLASRLLAALPQRLMLMASRHVL